MSWNYRLLAFENEDETYFQIHEVYYNDRGAPNGYTENPVPVYGESIKGVKWVIDEMKKALEKPTLWGGDKFPQEYLDRNDKTTKI